MCNAMQVLFLCFKLHLCSVGAAQGGWFSSLSTWAPEWPSVWMPRAFTSRLTGPPLVIFWMSWTPFKPLLKSDVFLATPLPGLAPPHARSLLCSGSNLPEERALLGGLPPLALELEAETRKGTSEETENHELPDPSRKISLPSSERALLADRPKRILDMVVALLQGDTSLRERKPAHRATNSTAASLSLDPSRTTPGHHSPQTHTIWVLRLDSDSVSGPFLHTSEPRPDWGGGEVRLYLLECLTSLCSSTLTVVVWLLGRQGANKA